MKYMYWLFIIFLIIIRRVLGMFIIWFAIPFRGYARNVVYRYHLDNDIFLKRLCERNPTRTSDGDYMLPKTSHSSTNGLVKVTGRKISSIEYYLVMVFIWLWLDDDANQDTYDSGFNKTIINKERKPWMPNFIVKGLIKGVEYSDNCPIRGNSFDLGDVRSKYPLFEFWSVFWWTLRNTAYNFNYKFHEIANENLVFSIIVKGYLIGWRKGTVVNGIQTYNFEFLYKIK